MSFGKRHIYEATTPQPQPPRGENIAAGNPDNSAWLTPETTLHLIEKRTIYGVVRYSLYGFGALAAVALGCMAYLGYPVKSSAASNVTGLSGAAYNSFVLNARQSCTATARANPINQTNGITDQQTVTYCECFATTMAKEVTSDEAVFTIMYRKFPDSLLSKALKVGLACARLARGG